MSLSSARSDVARAQSDVADLGKKLAAETGKEADLLRKQAAINSALGGRNSPAQTASKLRDLERVIKDLGRVQLTQADIQKRTASRRTDLARYQDRLSREEALEQRKLDDEEKRRRVERDRYTRDLEARMRALRTAEQAERSSPAPSFERDFDVFISHASEDKADFVRDLASSLQERGLRVWYDEFALKWGDSLRRKIDQGLARSRFGIVVLSEAFFRKEWPQRELDGLVALEVEGVSRILPIWHKVSKDEVRRFSPTLADKVAMNTAVSGLDEIVGQLVILLDPVNAEPNPQPAPTSNSDVTDLGLVDRASDPTEFATATPNPAVLDDKAEADPSGE